MVHILHVFINLSCQIDAGGTGADGDDPAMKGLPEGSLLYRICMTAVINGSHAIGSSR
jgi:hypothetical protein